jgi:hypothetical protein
MMHTIYTIRQRLNAELNNERGSVSIVTIGIIISLIIFIAFINIADYSVYSERRDIISKSIDYAVTAAIQEIDINTSREGLSGAYNEHTGDIELKNIYIDEYSADNAFFSTFTENTGINKSQINNNSMIIIINPRQSSIQYIIKTINGRSTGSILEPEDIETIINEKLGELNSSEGDKHIIYVNGNVKTKEFNVRPYYMVVIRNLPVKGLFRNRNTTFVSFKGANIERNTEQFSE